MGCTGAGYLDIEKCVWRVYVRDGRGMGRGRGGKSVCGKVWLCCFVCEEGWVVVVWWVAGAWSAGNGPWCAQA